MDFVERHRGVKLCRCFRAAIHFDPSIRNGSGPR